MAKQTPKFKSSTYEGQTAERSKLFADLDSAKKEYDAAIPPKILNWYDEKGRPTELHFAGAKKRF